MSFSKIFLHLSLLIICSTQCYAQNPVQPDSSILHQTFGNSEFIIVDSIQVLGNKKTKDYIILKELMFAEGDTIYRSEFENIVSVSNINLNNTGLFLTTSIDFNTSQNSTIVCTVLVTERWYVFPKPFFTLVDRNFNVWWVEEDHALNRTNYGVDLIWYNFTGNQDKLNMKAAFGYTQRFQLSYVRPHWNKHSDIGGGLSIAYANNKEIPYLTKDNKHVFFWDSAYVRERWLAEILLKEKINYYLDHNVKLKYHNNVISDSIAILNPNYFSFGNTKQEFLSLSYTLNYSNLDDRSYPLSGKYYELQAAKIGLGIFDPLTQLYFAAQFNQYLPLTQKLFFQWQIAGQYLIGSEYPYYNLASLGYCENFVRGYEYYVIDGEQTALFRSNLKWKLFETQFHAPIINWEVFENIPMEAYVKVFADAGFVGDKFYNQDNFLTNRFLYSGGIGLDVTTYYDWVFRLEATANALGEIGVFLHAGLDLNTYEDCNLW
ncbi:MAG: BamA/TamA family outer membrane protein [Chitinophagales bacterium]